MKKFLKSAFLMYLMCVMVFAAGCFHSGNDAVAAGPKPIPLHCLDYTYMDDDVFPDTVFLLANCVVEQPDGPQSNSLSGGGAVALVPVSAFNANDADAIMKMHYVASLSGSVLQVSKVLGNALPVVGYEYEQADSRQITKNQMAGIEQNLQYILAGSAVPGGSTSSLSPTSPAPPKEGFEAAPLTDATGGKGVDLEKLAESLVKAVQWYESMRPLLANIVAQSASDADDAVLNILDLTLKPLSITVKEVNGIVNNAQSATTTPEQKAQYTTEAALRIQQSTAAVQQYIWTLVYKKIGKD